MRNAHTGICIALLFVGQGLHAQDVLDRSNPTQQIEPEPLPDAKEDRVRIESAPTTDAPGEAPASGEVMVGAILIDGLTVLERSDFAAAIEPYAGRMLGRDELAALVDAVAAAARAKGYVLATAWIAPQSLTTGMLRITLDEGRIDAVRIKGADEPSLRRQLERLIGKAPLTDAALEREVLLAADLPGIRIRSTRFETENGQRTLVVDARREDASGTVSIATDGTRPAGPLRARIAFDANGLISPRDSIDLTFSATPVDPQELAFFSARYNVIVNDAGTSIGLAGSYSRTEPGAYLANRELLGESWQGAVRLRHPLLRRQKRSLWLEASGELQDLKQDRFGTLARHDRIALARLGFYGFGPLAGGALRGRATISQGLDILGATDLGDPLASRGDAPTDFTALSWWLNWRREIAARVSVSLATTGQLSTDPLLVAETYSLGGNTFLRGYDFGQQIGDEGAAGSAELRYDWPDAFGLVRRMQLYAFADGGVVTNRAAGRDDGSLASSGAGLRTDITRDLDLDFEVAVPLSEERYDTGNRNPRLNLRVSQSF